MRAKTYDIINAGAKNRFMANGRIVSNSGRLIQPQNFPRPTFKQVNAAIALVLHGGRNDDIETLFPPVLEVVASALRGCLIPRDGMKFVAPDLSQIEARVIAWLAGQDDILDVFARGDDVYTHTARKIGSDNRQLGKCLVLACIGKGAKVVTDRGLVSIENVTTTDLVWDGIEWVSHSGLVLRGQKETLDFYGVRLTPDHAVLCGRTWTPAQSVAQSDNLSRLALATASVNLPSRVWFWASAEGCELSPYDAPAALLSIWSRRPILKEARRLAAGIARVLQLSTRARNIFTMLVFAQTRSTGGGCSTEFLPASSAATTQTQNNLRTTVGAVFTSTSLGARRMERGTALPAAKTSYDTFLRWMAGTTRLWNWTAQTLTKATSRETFALSLGGITRSTGVKWLTCKSAFLNWKSKYNFSEKKIDTFDLSQAGPRNRFTIWTDAGPLIVHNCGYGMGPAKFADTALTYGLTLSPQYAEELVSDWREANSKIVGFWWDCDSAVKRCIRAAQKSPLGTAEAEINKYVSVRVNKARNGSHLMTLLLPCGRRLYYRDVNLEVEQPEREIAAAERDLESGAIDAAEFADIMAELSQRRPRESITYSGVNQITKKWGKVRTYSGKIAENITQAVARDVICEMALNISDAKLGELVLSVHDELIFEVPEDEAEARLEKILELMSVSPPWAPGLPVKAEGDVMLRYGK